MCGISGIIGKDWKEEELTRMVHIQAHRGPNHSGTYVKAGEIGLGHNRLSILDLSTAANQPMFSSDERYCIIFNGEIYNFLELRREIEREFIFHTTSDTEVLLYCWQKWGSQCLNKLNGMFAFAIWDLKTKKFFATRDRFGVKPFYYAFHKGNFYFASEIKALWAAGVEKKPFDPVWAAYLSKGTYSVNGLTFWSGISELQAGCCLEYDGHELMIKKWYDFEKNISETQVYSDDMELENDYTDVLIDAVSLRFRADVPVGFNISGGLDSSVLLAMVNYLYPKQGSIKAYSFYTGNDRYDELPWVRNMISHSSNPLTSCLLDATQAGHQIQAICRAQDEPFGGIPTIAYSRVFEEATKDVVVLLDGQGMDEAWAGYDYYSGNNGYTVQGTTTSPTRATVLKTGFAEYSFSFPSQELFEDPLKNLQYRDLFRTKLPRALRFNDRVSMMYSTELREPFLDYRLVELAFAQNSSMKIRNNQSKWTLRRIASKFLHPQISLAPKRPVQTPQREWLADELRPIVEDSVVKLSDHGWFDADILRREWQAYLSGSKDNSFFVWQWVNTAYLLFN
jgi:asparagine synthase (glutamine-hydrolysing)